MAKKLANDYLLWVESSTPGTYNVCKGQKGTTINRQAAQIDLTTKDDSGYGVLAPGLRNLTIQTGFIPNLPDANGYQRLETLCKASPQAAFKVQIRKGGLTGATPGDVVFEGSVYGNFDTTAFEQNEGVSDTVTLYAAAAPTTDLLA